MDGTSQSKKGKYQLHVALSAVFSSLLIVVGAALIGYSYTRARSIALTDANYELEMLATYLETRVSKLYGPAQNIVDLASRSRLLSEDSPPERSTDLEALTEALRQRPEIESIYFGAEDGDFTLVRSLQGREKARAAMDAPADAVFAVQSISRRVGSQAREQLKFFDDSNQVVAQRDTEWTGFDPRRRQWYRMAIAEEAQVVTRPYVFFTTREVGVTIARRLVAGDGVVGADLSLADLSEGLAENLVTASSRLVLLNDTMSVIASSDLTVMDLLKQSTESDQVDLPLLSELDDPVYKALSSGLQGAPDGGRYELEIDGRTWLAWVSFLPVRAGGELSLVTLLPREELLVDAIRTRNQSLLISLLMLLLTLSLSIVVSRRISGSLRNLAHEAEHIRELRFDAPIHTRSRIREVADLATTMEGMKGSIRQFLAISHALSAERSYEKLLDMILQEARTVCRADAGAILLRTEDWDFLEVSVLHNVATGESFGGFENPRPPFQPVRLTTEDEPASIRTVEDRTVQEASVVKIDDLEVTELQSAVANVQRHFHRETAPAAALLSVPLLTHEGGVIGVLQLVNSRDGGGDLRPFSDDAIPYIQALCSDAAVALDNRRLLKAHKELLESFIHVLAGAIDAKSPYTHGHCQRVPEIARMIARAAEEQTHGAFSDFALSEDEWYELHLASWLHDCGKITTPEYVVDKATKLETLGNRIHEIRTRFEVVWRDAEIEYLKSVLNEVPPEEAGARLTDIRSQLGSDFEFIARINLGETPLNPEDCARIDEIGSRVWLRNFDDTLGLSHIERELKLRESDAHPDLPVAEKLLSDKPEHVIPRAEGQHPFGDEPHDFNMEVPDRMYNRGEIYNLKISRGTLTKEERFKINEHIIQTLRMLQRLPFPRELRRVPRWAGTHHEKLDGTGYPCRLAGNELSVPERIMAVADVFEALTAADRPYMTPRKLSVAMNIMRSMAQTGHLCPEVFKLLLSSGVYRSYAEQYLHSEQVDDVNVEEITRGV